MNRTDRERARRISDYVDSLVVLRRTRADRVRVYGPEDTEFPELANLARELAGIRLIPRSDLMTRIERFLPAAAARRDVHDGHLWWRLRSAIEHSLKRLPRLFPRNDSSGVVRRTLLRH